MKASIIQVILFTWPFTMARRNEFLRPYQEIRDLVNDDRHNPNVNIRNVTNNPALPFFTVSPSKKPTQKPTKKPTKKPTNKPSVKPTQKPSKQPSQRPSRRPSYHPSPKPTAKPTDRPSMKPTVYPSSRPTFRPSTNPTAAPSANPTALPSLNPTMIPTQYPTTHPSLKPTSQPSHRPTSRPSVTPTFRPTPQPSAQPTSNPTSPPSAQPTASPTSHPSFMPTAHPTSSPTSSPSFKPTSKPSAHPTPLPSAQPTASPTLSPSINLCARDHFGNFGNTSSSNVMLVSYNYEMMINITTMLLENTTKSNVVRDVEYAITDILLKSLFAECMTYYENEGTKKRSLVRQRDLGSGQVVGINAIPNDIITGESCAASTTAPSSANVPSMLSCDVLQGRFAIYVDDALMKDTTGLEAIYDRTLTLIKNGMESGELALISNDAVVLLRYVDESDKDLLPFIANMSSAGQQQDIIQWSLVGLAILAVLFVLLAAGRLMRKRNKKEIAIFHDLDDDKSINMQVYDFEGLSQTDISLTQPSDESLSPFSRKKNELVFSSSLDASPDKSDTLHAYVTPEPNFRINERTSYPPEMVEIDNFMEYRFAAHDEMGYDEYVLPDNVPSSRMEMKNACTSRISDDSMQSLNHVCLKSPKRRPSMDRDEENYTYEAMGTNRGVTPKCSICFKNAEGLMRRCQCGKSSCDKIAHASCIYGRNPTPSISYPGTPPPMLPPVLCGSENRGLNHRSQSYDEENGIMGCMGCR